MAKLVFINVQDQSGRNQNLIKRHVAADIHRKKRLVEVFRHQRQSSLQKPLPLRTRKTPQTALEDDLLSEWETLGETLPIQNGIPPRSAGQTCSRSQRQRDSKSKAMVLRWRVGGGPTAIKPPGDDLRIEYVLSESFNWIMGQYTCSWSSLVQRDPTFFDMNDQVEIFREAFYIVTDLLEVGKPEAAFAVLRHTLDTIPLIFRNPHPELLFTIVELAYGINMTWASDLHVKVRPHVAELASVILGTQHPLTILLKSTFDMSLNMHVTELVFKCIIDTLSKTFGLNAYQTLVQQMGRSQFYARTGRGDEGQRLIADVQRRWTEQYGVDSALARLAELELSLMRVRGSQHPDPSIQTQANNAMLRIEIMSGVYSNKFTDKPSSYVKLSENSPITTALAQWFLQNKRYSFALHCYGRAKRSEEDNHSGPGRPLADLIADTAQSALRDTLSRPNSIMIFPSQASMPESVLAVA